MSTRRQSSARPPLANSGAPAGDRSPAAARSRRRFMQLIAAGSAAALASPIAALAAEKAPVRRPAAAKPAPRAAAPPSRPGVTAKELEKQKKYVADALKVIRDFELPPGSDQAFVYRPMRAGRARKGR
jgi:hypothetical protein